MRFVIPTLKCHKTFVWLTIWQQLATFVRTHEKALANALQTRRVKGGRSTQTTNGTTNVPSTTVVERPSTSASSGSHATPLSVGSLNVNANNVKSAKLALTPHHLFYLLSRFEELGINVGPMKVRLENLHDSTSSANYVSFLSNTQRSNSHGSDAGSIRSVSSVRNAMSSMAALWSGFGIGASISAARTERQRAALQADMKYLYSAFTKIPCLRLAPDWKARLIKGYEEFPFDSAVPLHAFKNLQALEVSCIDFRQFFGWDKISDQLRSLTLRRAGIEDPADILIDIVLDDMDKRRRRTSKVQSSPSNPWVGSSSPRRSSSVFHPELHRAATAPLNSERRGSIANLKVGSLTPSEHAIDDAHAAYNAKRSLVAGDLDDMATSPGSQPPRPRSISPSRSGSPRHNHTASRNPQRLRRSGSGSSQSSLSESWHHHARSSSGNILAMGILPPSKWRFLRHLSLADNSITSIPITSLAPLSNTLYSFDLSSNLFTQMPDSLATLTALRALNMSHCMIDSLHSLKRNPLPAITALNLRGNRLQSLAGIERLYPLERLDLRDNHLTDPMEMARLTGIPDLHEIWLEGNPFTRTHKDFRILIFNLFRKCPGCTQDILIDGTGPSYSEKRQLVERAPVPDSVPVVKPQAAEMPAVDVSKPAIIYGGVNDGAPLTRERPLPRAVMSETNTHSTRRRKTPKRRIVELATNNTPQSVMADYQDSNRLPDIADTSIAGQENYRISHSPEPKLLPPLRLSPKQNSSSGTQANIPRADPRKSSASPLIPPAETEGFQETPVKWDNDGEAYRQKIEALRDSIGNGYLSVLSDQKWTKSAEFEQIEVPTSPVFAAPQCGPALPSIRAVHSGRTLG